MNIVLEDIEKSYNKKTIFQSLSYNFEDSKRYGIAGRNGSGKSTLLKIISGYITPNKGTVSCYRDKKLISLDNLFYHTSFAAPYIDIPLEFTLFELFDFHFSLRNRYLDTANTDINSHFSLPINIPIQQFSSGMLQRVKLALAFFTDSSLLILDEPTETLDDSGIDLYKKLLSKYTENRTTIIASNKENDFSS